MGDQDKAVTAEERFTMPRKAFIAPSKPLIDLGKKKEVTEPVDLSKLPTLHLPTFGNKVAEKKVREKKSREKQEVNYGPPVVWGPEHVVTDEEFIIRTRAYSIHDDGIKELFYANGGADIVALYETIATAFDALRRYKMAKLSGILDDVTADTPEWQRVINYASHDIKLYVSGTQAEAQVIRERALQVAEKQRQDEEWMNEPLIAKVG